MATLADWQIHDLALHHNLITPYNQEQVNPASYDVTLADKILIEEPEGWRKVDISIPGFKLPPGGFVLACTAETVSIPPYLECQFQLKSSRGREGYEHALAGYIDPGFEGQVTLELTNLNKYHWLPLQSGLRIGQLRFMKMDQPPMRTYAQTGRYQGDRGAVMSKG